MFKHKKHKHYYIRQIILIIVFVTLIKLFASISVIKNISSDSANYIKVETVDKDTKGALNYTAQKEIADNITEFAFWGLVMITGFSVEVILIPHLFKPY